MCLESPKVPAAAAPVAPIAPLESPKPMALAEAVSTKRQAGVSQLRIASKATPAVLGTGAAANAALTLQGRKDQLDAQIAANGG